MRDPLRSNAVTHFNQGQEHAKLGQLIAAERCFCNALELDPSLAEAWNNLGNVLLELGRLEEAERTYREAIALRPDFVGAHHNLAIALGKLGRQEDALRVVESALLIDSTNADLHFSLGKIWEGFGNLEKAEQSYSQVLLLRPDYVAAHNNLGAVRMDLGRVVEAEGSFLSALALDPNLAAARANLANALFAMGRLEEAERSYRTALSQNAELPHVHSNLLLAMNCMADRTAPEIYAEHREYDRHSRSKLSAVLHRNSPEPERPLRVGYVSGDFREHAVAFFVEPLFANHDRRNFQVFCYYNHHVSDSATHRLKSAVDCWRDITGLDDNALVRLIQADAIDVLIDLSGHTKHDRLPAFARKPAPVQVTWLGYLNTTGLTAMDYRITDSHAAPEGMFDEYHSEKLIRLPGCQWCYRPPAEHPEVGPLPKIRTGETTFAAFTSPAKVNRRVVELWRRLLERVPRSRLLVVNYGLSALPAAYVDMFAKCGIPRGRLRLLGHVPFGEYLAMHNTVDLVLDTFPYTGGTTTCHALWMGVPVISLAGETVTSRGGASLLQAVGLGELVTQSPEQYLQTATMLANETGHLAALRSDLRRRMKASALMDEKSFARDMEHAYRAMWRTWTLNPRSSRLVLNRGGVVKQSLPGPP